MTNLADWRPCAVPTKPQLSGRYITLDLYDAARDGVGLYDAIGGEAGAGLWAHVPIGPFEDAAALANFYSYANEKLGWVTYIFRAPDHPNDEIGEVLGMASYMRLRPEHGSAEVGSVIFSPKLQRTPAATEAMYLMARYVFEELGYRRYEWKCNATNEASARAAKRFGFTFEGTFRQDQVMKGKNRDTHWFSMLDCEWPLIAKGFEAWLRPENFDAEGRQVSSLVDLRGEG